MLNSFLPVPILYPQSHANEHVCLHLIKQADMEYMRERMLAEILELQLLEVPGMQRAKDNPTVMENTLPLFAETLFGLFPYETDLPISWLGSPWIHAYVYT